MGVINFSRNFVEKNTVNGVLLYKIPEIRQRLRCLLYDRELIPFIMQK
jgi:hypothetical protein